MRLGAGRSTLTRLEARRALIAALENGELDEFAQGQRKDVEKRIKVARKFLEDNPDEGASLGQCGCLGVTQLHKRWLASSAECKLSWPTLLSDASATEPSCPTRLQCTFHPSL